MLAVGFALSTSNYLQTALVVRQTDTQSSGDHYVACHVREACSQGCHGQSETLDRGVHLVQAVDYLPYTSQGLGLCGRMGDSLGMVSKRVGWTPWGCSANAQATRARQLSSVLPSQQTQQSGGGDSNVNLPRRQTLSAKADSLAKFADH